jgi:predicted membrane chloride channel (bestrophin family)
MLGLTYIQFDRNMTLKISDQGHTFVTMVMSFLLVSRVTMALVRYGDARNQIGAMFRNARKLGLGLGWK